MTIKRGGVAEPISGNIRVKEIPSYCPKCEHNGIRDQRTVIRERQYLPHELIAGELPYDHDQWRQCWLCGTCIPTHDIKKEGSLDTDIPRITTKFSTAARQPEHYQKPKHRRGFNERDQRNEDDIKDEDLKKELKKGAKLLSYSEI